MYLDYYHLTREPFHITPDPAFLFLGESHKQALATIMYGIEKKKGFVAITGPVGVGKTTIVRSYLDNLDNRFLKIIYVFNANITFEDLMVAICQELGITITPGSISQTVSNLHLFLINEYEAVRTVVVIVDEAQNMPVETLENLRMLSNLETAEDKLIQIVLVGQPELDGLLSRYELRQLKQRIAMRATISALTPEESLDYISHRLAIADAKAFRIFTKTALRKILHEANGIPRVINILCDNALITACGYELKKVTIKAVKEVIADFNGKQRHHRSRLRLAVPALLLCLVAVFFLLFQHGHFSSLVQQNSPAVTIQEAPVPSINPNQASPKPPPADPGVVKAEAIIEQTNPPVAPKQVDVQGTGRERAKIIAKRTVEGGDSLSKLTEEVYGRSADQFLEFVKDNNPNIKDVHNVRMGSVVNFPELPRNLKSPQEGP